MVGRRWFYQLMEEVTSLMWLFVIFYLVVTFASVESRKAMNFVSGRISETQLVSEPVPHAEALANAEL